jgi:hypothetical protein
LSAASTWVLVYDNGTAYQVIATGVIDGEICPGTDGRPVRAERRGIGAGVDAACFLGNDPDDGLPRFMAHQAMQPRPVHTEVRVAALLGNGGWPPFWRD